MYKNPKRDRRVSRLSDNVHNPEIVIEDDIMIIEDSDAERAQQEGGVGYPLKKTPPAHSTFKKSTE